MATWLLNQPITDTKTFVTAVPALKGKLTCRSCWYWSTHPPQKKGYNCPPDTAFGGNWNNGLQIHSCGASHEWGTFQQNETAPLFNSNQISPINTRGVHSKYIVVFFGTVSIILVWCLGMHSEHAHTICICSHHQSPASEQTDQLVMSSGLSEYWKGLGDRQNTMPVHAHTAQACQWGVSCRECTGRLSACLTSECLRNNLSNVQRDTCERVCVCMHITPSPHGCFKPILDEWCVLGPHKEGMRVVIADEIACNSKTNADWVHLDAVSYQAARHTYISLVRLVLSHYGTNVSIKLWHYVMLSFWHVLMAQESSTTSKEES